MAAPDFDVAVVVEIRERDPHRPGRPVEAAAVQQDDPGLLREAHDRIDRLVRVGEPLAEARRRSGGAPTA